MKPLPKKTVVIIGVVTVVILAVATFLLNPGRRLADERNNARYENIKMIVDGITEYASKNNGTLPRSIPVSDNCYNDDNEICKKNAKSCSGLVNLSLLVDEKHMDFMPVDPKEKSGNGTGYNIVQSETGRITLCSPHSELGKTVEYIK